MSCAGERQRGSLQIERNQTRGGGRGGAAGSECKLKLARAGLIAAAVGFPITAETTVPEKLKHLSAHPAAVAQLSETFLSQGSPSGQQSAGMAEADIPGIFVLAITPATGSIATEKATRATKMTRKVCMAVVTPICQRCRGSNDGIVTARGLTSFKGDRAGQRAVASRKAASGAWTPEYLPVDMPSLYLAWSGC